MAKYGFIEVLEQEMDKIFPFDYEIQWDKKNHAVQLSFLLEIANQEQVALLDEEDQVFAEELLLEEAILFVNPAKSRYEEGDYLTVIPYEPKVGFSREFLAYFVQFLSDLAQDGLDAIFDFLQDEEAEDFELEWNHVAFDRGLEEIEEGSTYPYPRY
ncbi:DUF3013 family protein [Streptococcus sp. 10F2]